jgi:AcrR family transcriptional regulator
MVWIVATSEPENTVKAGRKIHGLDAGEREQQRREQILESALTTFADHGYANTSVEQICHGANVSTKSFYRIFDNREDLYLALYNRFRDGVFEQMSAILDDALQSEGAAEELLLDALVDAYFDDSRNALVIQGPSRAVTPTLERVRRDTRKLAAEFLEAVWRRFGLAGNHSGVAVAVMGGIFDLFTTALVDGKRLTDQELADLRVEVKRFYRAVRAGLPAV